jgi:hypothetical protein
MNCFLVLRDEVSWPPAAVERGSLRAVDAEVAEPAAARDRLDPAVAGFLGLGGPEVKVDGAGAARRDVLEQ